MNLKINLRIYKDNGITFIGWGDNNTNYSIGVLHNRLKNKIKDFFGG